MSRDRVVALVALVAAVAAIVALIVLLVRDVVALGEALGALAVVRVGGWVALSRRGVLRVVGLALVVAAVGAGATALVLRDAVNELIALAITLALFGAATRTALREASRPQPPETRTTSPPVPLQGDRG